MGDPIAWAYTAGSALGHLVAQSRTQKLRHPVHQTTHEIRRLLIFVEGMAKHIPGEPLTVLFKHLAVLLKGATRDEGMNTRRLQDILRERNNTTSRRR